MGGGKREDLIFSEFSYSCWIPYHTPGLLIFIPSIFLSTPGQPEGPEGWQSLLGGRETPALASSSVSLCFLAVPSHAQMISLGTRESAKGEWHPSSITSNLDS